MRILIVTHAPLSPEFGAGQMAINLGEVLERQGHEVVLWSPYPLDVKTRWWQTTNKMRLKLDDFIQNQQPFDLIDSPAIFITKKLSRSSIVVARSVQPDLLYLAYSLNFSVSINFKCILKACADNLYMAYQAWIIIKGWQRANYIFCLGSLECQWMKKWFPWWQSKIFYYVNALSQNDRQALAKIRQQRKQLTANNLKFLWIGRWVNHKGIDTLINFIKSWTAKNKSDTFTIAGCGEDIDISVYFSQEFIESGKLRIVPTFNRNQLNNLLKKHNVGLFTSRVEGWGLVLNEMLESGMPVFATSAGGVKDLKPFTSKQLQSFPPSTSVIASTISNSMDMDKYYEIFTWDKIAKLYVNLVFNKINNYLEPIL